MVSELVNDGHSNGQAWTNIGLIHDESREWNLSHVDINHYDNRYKSLAIVVDTGNLMVAIDHHSYLSMCIGRISMILPS